MPQLYGELCPDDVKAKGFELVESDTELWDDESTGQQGSRHSSQDGEISELTRESWEVGCYFLLIFFSMVTCDTFILRSKCWFI